LARFAFSADPSAALKLFPRREIFLKSEDTESLQEFFHLLKLGLLLHRVTTATMPEGFSIFPSGDKKKAKSAPMRPTPFPPTSDFEIVPKQNTSTRSQASKSHLTRPGSDLLEADASVEVGAPSVEGLAEVDVSIQGESKIVSEETLQRIIGMTPSNLHIEDWKMYYSLEHGADLQKMYKAVRGIRETILLIQDSDRCVFGAFASSAYQTDDNYYGNGMTFVFKMVADPSDKKSGGTLALKQLRDVDKHGWSGDNELFMLVKKASLAFGGGGDGGYAFRLDKNLSNGRFLLFLCVSPAVSIRCLCVERVCMQGKARGNVGGKRNTCGCVFQ